MAFYAETLALIRTAITARLNGGEVESYSVGAVNLSLCPLETLFKLETQYATLAANETAVATGASRIHFANLRPGG
jgi:hypothetical protein